MVSRETDSTPKRRKKRPLTRANLRDMALAYVARFSTTASKLEAYLHRKIRERGLVDDDGGDALDQVEVVSKIVERIVELRYVDDEAYAKARSGSLLRRGYGGRRVDEALRHAGVDDGVRQEASPGLAQAREAALIMARKRRFGPFAPLPIDSEGDERPPIDPKTREKQIAAMLRAGHEMDIVRTIIDAISSDWLEDWVIEAQEEEQTRWHD